MSKKTDKAWTQGIQRLLNGAGYALEITGVNDPNTQAAIRDFRLNNDLGDGVLLDEDAEKALRNWRPLVPPPKRSTDTKEVERSEPDAINRVPPPPIAKGPKSRPTRGKPYWERKTPQAPPGTPRSPAAPPLIPKAQLDAVEKFWQQYAAGEAEMEDYPSYYGEPGEQDIGGANSPLASEENYQPNTHTAESATTPVNNISKAPAPGQFRTAFGKSPAATSGAWSDPNDSLTDEQQFAADFAPTSEPNAAAVAEAARRAGGPQTRYGLFGSQSREVGQPATPPVAPQGRPSDGVSLRDYMLPEARPEAPMPPTPPNALGKVGLPWGRKYDSVTDMIGTWGQSGQDAVRAIYGKVVGEQPQPITPNPAMSAPPSGDTFGPGRGGPWLKYRKRTR